MPSRLTPRQTRQPRKPTRGAPTRGEAVRARAVRGAAPVRVAHDPWAAAAGSPGAGAATSAIERTVTGMGYELVDVERAAQGLLRVTIDRVPGRTYPVGDSASVTVDDCEAVTRQLQYALEVEGCDYARLEVSSPGLDRPLKRLADYERFAGAEVDLTLKEAFEGRRRYRGRLLAGEGGRWRLVLPGGEQALDFTLDEVREARLVPVVDFKGRRARPVTPEASGSDEADGGRRE